MRGKEIETNELIAPGRSRLAAEWRLMAWVRTGFSMIAWGFGSYEVLQFIGEQSKVPLPQPQSPRIVGLALIGIGTFAVITASLQHWKA